MTDRELLELLVADVGEMKTRLNSMDEKIGTMDAKIDRVEATLKAEIKKTNDKVRNVQLTLENVTNRNIETIAEGHFELRRKLEEALQVEKEKERALIRINILENEVRMIKEEIGI